MAESARWRQSCRPPLHREARVLISSVGWVIALALVLAVAFDVEMVARCDVDNISVDASLASRPPDGTARNVPAAAARAGFVGCAENASWWMWADTITSGSRSRLWQAAASSGVPLNWWREAQAAFVSGFICLSALVYFLIANRRPAGGANFQAHLHDVGAKLSIAAAAAVAVALTIVVIEQLTFTALVSAFASRSASIGAAAIWLESSLYLGWLHMAIASVAWVCWALPIFGWIALACSFAPRFGIGAALLLPVAAVLVELLVGGDLVRSLLIQHLLPNVWPPRAAVSDTLDTLGTFLNWRLWCGMLLGAALVATGAWRRAQRGSNHR